MLVFISFCTFRYININFFSQALANSSLVEKYNLTSDEFLVHAPRLRLWTQPWIITVCLQMITWKDGEALKYCCQQYVDEFHCLAVMLPTPLVICKGAYKEKHLAQPQPSNTEHILAYKKNKPNQTKPWETHFVTNFLETSFVTVYQGLACTCYLLQTLIHSLSPGFNATYKATSSWSLTDFLQWARVSKRKRKEEGTNTNMLLWRKWIEWSSCIAWLKKHKKI